MIQPDDPADREKLRRQHKAAGWRRDDRIERMATLHEIDPAEFLRTFGPGGLIQIGLYERGRDAAGGSGPEAA